MQPAQLQQLLQQGGNAFGQGNIRLALECCSAVLMQIPNEVNALHLKALALKAGKQFSESKESFEKAVSGQPKNPEIRNNFGNLLRDMGRYEEATVQYRKALQYKPGFVDPWFNMGLTAQAAGDHVGATDALKQALKLKPQDARYHNALGISLKELERLDEAANAYSAALKISPGHYRALHNLGVVYRLQNKQAEAIECFNKALAIEPRVAELRYNLANALYELGEYDKADEEYRTAIGLKPDFLDAHETLNKLYWEHDKRDLFAKSYQVGIKAAPMSAELREAQVKALELSGRMEEAELAADTALKEIGAHAGILRHKARMRANAGDSVTCIDFFNKAVATGPDKQPIRMDFARFLIQGGDYETALTHLEAAEKLEPYDQQMWAYRGLCWRFLGDKREAWLNDYEQFILPLKIETPEGYGSLEEFLAELSETVNKMHITEVRPLEQTLRGGTQTHGKLFFRPEPIIQKLRTQLERCIHTYVDMLPDDPTHPLLRRKSHQFRFAGSWSVKLKSGGFHVNHIHPQGWISSAFYVDVPGCVNASDDKSGWIKFGESGLSLGDEREIIKKFVKPEPGLLALFPSYVWHGTVAFNDGGTRVTTPFDVVPL